jgi:predicted GNAT family acetyltransferase
MHIEHDTEAHRFLVQVPSGTAILAYVPAGARLLELYSTYVPPPDRGRGVGGHLVEAALKYAREREMRVIPTCWYVAQWVREHPEHADLLTTQAP